MLSYMHIETENNTIKKAWYVNVDNIVIMIDGRDAIISYLDTYSDIQYISNLKKQDYWVLGLFKVQNLQSVDYIKPSLYTLCKLFNVDMSVKNIQMVNKLVNNLDYYSKKYLGEHCVKIQDDVNARLKRETLLLPVELDEVIGRSYQETFINKEIDKKTIIVTLKKPKSQYFNWILNGTEVPKTLEYDFIDMFQMPDEKNRVQWLKDKKLPYIAKIEYGSYIGEHNEYSKDLIKMQQIKGYGGKYKNKNFATNIEVDNLSNINNLKIESVFLFKNKMLLSDVIKLSNNVEHMASEIMDLSVSNMMFNEILLQSLLSKSKNPIKNTNDYVQVNDVYAKSKDMSEMLNMALVLKKYGFAIIAYGSGNITVSCDRERFEQLKTVCFHCGLIIPGNVA